jgi:hypothetical protein
MLQQLKKRYESIERRFVYNPRSEELFGEKNPPAGARAFFRAQLYSTLLFLTLHLLGSLFSWNWLHSFASFFLFVFLYSGSWRRIIVNRSGYGYPDLEPGDVMCALITLPIYLVITIVIHRVMSSLWIG